MTVHCYAPWVARYLRYVCEGGIPLTKGDPQGQNGPVRILMENGKPVDKVVPAGPPVSTPALFARERLGKRR